MNRRFFLKSGSIALASVGMSLSAPGFLQRAILAQTRNAVTGGRRKTLIAIFQRGAVDGLNVVVPFGESSYYDVRPSIAIPKPAAGNAEAAINLDGFFGLHPSLNSLKPLWDAKQLAIVHASGSPDNTRSHFDAQDYMESGTPGVKSTEDGWLNRAIAGVKEPDASPFRAVAMGGALPRTLAGSVPAVAMADIRGFAVGGRGPGGNIASNTFEAMYEKSVDTVLHGTGNETFEAVKMLKSADPEKYAPAAGADYPRGRFGDSLRQVAQLVKANLGVEVAFADIGGWDHHVNEGSVQGQIANLTREFSQSIAAFWTDLGDLAENTVIVTMSEFGRTARENGNRGTDHGHANVMFVLGGPVKGGRMYGRWPGLETEHLYEGRDLAVTTDFRQVLSEAVANHLGNKDLTRVFPGFDKGTPKDFLKYLG
jgi:uncharacterized protein (DUF1501 family)